MSRGLHLISCYLPNNAFVDGFFAAMADELRTHDHELLLLPTYAPASDALQFIQISYTLGGYHQLARTRAAAEPGLVPAAFGDAETAWTRRATAPADARAAVATCSAFFGQMLDELEPDSVSIWNPTVPQGRLLQMACLSRAIPCFGIERGVFAETMMVESREVGAQADVALNPALRSLLAASRADQERLQQIRGYYAQRDFSRYAMAPACSAAELREDVGIAPNARVVALMLSVAAANWNPQTLPGMRFNSPWFASAQQAVDALLAALPSDTYLLVQDHPLDRGHWKPTPHPRMRHVRGVHLQSLFDAADALAFLGATTVQHEALLTDRPLLLLSRSQLSGQRVAYEYRGTDLPGLVQRALKHEDRSSQREAVARYVPFLFDHLLYGPHGSPTRHSAADLARHLAGLESSHTAPVPERIERWLSAAAADLALDTSTNPSLESVT